MKGEHVVHLKRGFWNDIWSGMSTKAIYMKISKGSEGIIGQTTNFRSITIWVNSHHLYSETLTGLKSVRNIHRQKGRKQA